MKNRKKIAALLSAVGIAVGVGIAMPSPANAELYTLGYYYDSKDPIQYGSCSTLESASIRGQSSFDQWLQTQTMRYNSGTGAWVGQSSPITYKLNKNSYYNHTVKRQIGLAGGAYIYRVRSRTAAYNEFGNLVWGAYDYSAGKNLSCT